MPVAVAMSSGVDSSVAALLLKRSGSPIFGITMVLHEKHAQAARHAAQICRFFGAEHHVFDFTAEFEHCVLSPYWQTYRKGRTPNPCVPCNAKMKFGLLFEKARALGAQSMATGHYACLSPSHRGEVPRILRPASDLPDETYFLYAIDPKIRSSLLFPLGGKSKDEVRALAKDAGLDSWSRPSSKDTCFPELARQGMRACRWSVFDEKGHFLGRSRTLSRVTVGQRKGLGLPLGEKMFVLRVDPLLAKLVVGPQERLYARRLRAVDVIWSSGGAPGIPLQVEAKARYNQVVASATVEVEDVGQVMVSFAEPQRALTPGQSVVFYRNRELLGGGVIESVMNGSEG